MTEEILYFYGQSPSIENISFLDWPEPSGHCLTVYFTGCGLHCKDCHNPELQKYGKVYDQIPYDEFVSKLFVTTGRAYTDRVVLMGGDPLFEQNRDFTKRLIFEYGHKFEFCVYTGYSWDLAREYSQGARYIKCGSYDESRSVKSEKTSSYLQFASTNQELYKLDRTNNLYIKLTDESGRVHFNDSTRI